MKTVGITNIKRSWSRILLFNLMVIIACSCEKEPDTIVEEANLSFKKNLSAGPFEFTGTVYDIASTPDGSILVGLNYEDS
jgi:hypothetical protein